MQFIELCNKVEETYKYEFGNCSGTIQGNCFTVSVKGSISFKLTVELVGSNVALTFSRKQRVYTRNYESIEFVANNLLDLTNDAMFKTNGIEGDLARVKEIIAEMDFSKPEIEKNVSEMDFVDLYSAVSRRLGKQFGQCDGGFGFGAFDIYVPINSESLGKDEFNIEFTQEEDKVMSFIRYNGEILKKHSFTNYEDVLNNIVDVVEKAKLEVTR